MKVQTPRCFHCGETGEVEVPEEGYRRWQGGELIQRAMPELSPDLREQLITGTHPACWEAMFADEED